MTEMSDVTGRPKNGEVVTPSPEKHEQPGPSDALPATGAVPNEPTNAVTEQTISFDSCPAHN